MTRAVLTATLVALLVVEVIPQSRAAAAKISDVSPCGIAASAKYSHVVWIMLENVGYSIVGSSEAPYFNELTDRCGLATTTTLFHTPASLITLPSLRARLKG